MLGRSCQGMTEPVFCRSDDGHEYVVKGSYAGNRALIAEWVAGRLGRLLGLPIPEVVQLALDPQLFAYSIKVEEVRSLGRGVLFGSLRAENVVELRPWDLPLVDENLQAEVLAFDWWIANPDRACDDDGGNPNLLWSDHQRRVVVMDHNLAFSPAQMADFWAGHMFRQARRRWSPQFIARMAVSFRAALAELPAIWAELPDDWTEVETGLTLERVSELLWTFEREPARFWEPE